MEAPKALRETGEFVLYTRTQPPLKAITTVCTEVLASSSSCYLSMGLLRAAF